MRIVAPKQQILENSGYAYSFDRQCYINRQARKIFSVEFVQDNSDDDLLKSINATGPPPGEWQFYFNAEPSAAVKREFSMLLG